MRLVVIGGVAAGLSAASRARRIDPSLDIVVLEKGSRISYGACGLPYLIEGQVSSVDQLTVYQPEVFEKERNIRIRTRTEVTGIQHHRRELALAGGERLPYDRLVIATGARPQRWDHPRAFSLHTDQDGERLQAFLDLERPRRAAVIGGGYIGLEMATALRARGIAVTLYEAGTTLLHTEDEWLTQTLQAELARCQVDVRMMTRIRSMADLQTDCAIVATGLTPNSELAAEAGVELGPHGAIRTGVNMETNLTGVYAAGDCAAALQLVTGRPTWVPLGTTANKQGRVAGANAAGARELFEGIVGTAIVRVGGMGIATTGLSESQARREGFRPVRARIEARDKPRYFQGRPITVDLVADRATRRLLGATIVGEEGVSGRINVVATALATQMKLDDFATLDLAYSPPFAPVMDPLLIAAQQTLKLLDSGR